MKNYFIGSLLFAILFVVTGCTTPSLESFSEIDKTVVVMSSATSLPATVTLTQISTETPTLMPVDPPIPTVFLATQTSFAPFGCGATQNIAIETEIIRLINLERSKFDLGDLEQQDQLTSAARGHSVDMACNVFFSHTSPTTGSPFDRILVAGYVYSAAGENIAAGYPDAATVVEGWMNSQGHRDNILSLNFTEIGIGYINLAESDYESYYTAVFGAP